MRTLTIDPVCGMEVGASSRFQLEYHATTYHFCCQKCCARFQRDPGEFTYPEDGEFQALVRSVDLRLHEPERNFRSSDWVLLFLVPALALLAAFAMQSSSGNAWDWTNCIHDFTGLLLILFSAFKLAELKAFATVFSTYDLLAKFFRPYAYLYPFVELVLGLAFLAGRYLTFVSVVTASVMVFSSAGLFIALGKTGAKYPSSDVASPAPLSSGTLVANLSIAAMAVLIGWFGQA